MTVKPERPNGNSYWVLDGRFLAGEYPGALCSETALHRLKAFLAAGVNHYIDLTEAGELLPYSKILQDEADSQGVAVEHQRFPVVDGGVPDREGMRTILDAVDGALARGRRVYIHCWGGVGRTGTAVGCYLVRHGRSGQEALDQLSQWWATVDKIDRHPHSPERPEQERFVLTWSE